MKAAIFALSLASGAFCGGYLLGNSNGFEAGQWDGKATTVVYCNLSPDFCRLQLSRMAEAEALEQPAIYKTMYGQTAAK